VLNRQPAKYLPVFLALLIPLAVVADPPGEATSPDLEDKVQPFQPRRPRTPADLDRLEATSLFAYGRLLFQQKKYDAALWNFQHAWQRDPTNPTLSLEVVSLALRLKRDDTAARYAALVDEFPSSQLSQLPRIAILLTRQRDFEAAARVYQRMVELRGDSLQGSALLAIHLELGRLYQLAEKKQQAATTFDFVNQVLADPDKYKVSEADLKRVITQPQAVDTMIADSYLKAGRFEQARQVYERLVRTEKDNPLHAYRLATIAAADDDPAAALEQLNQYLESGSESAGLAAYSLLSGLLAAEANNASKGARQLLEQLERLHQEQPGNRALMTELGDRLLAQEEWSRARDVLLKLLGKRKSASIYGSLAAAYLGLWTDGQRDSETVDSLLRLLGQLAGSEGNMNNTVFQQAAETEALVDQLLQHAEKTLSGDEDTTAESDQVESPIQVSAAEVAVAAASLAIAADRADQASALFEIAIKLEPGKRSKWLETWSIRLIMADQYSQASDVLQRAVESDQVAQKQIFYFLLAGAASLADETERAISAAKKAVELSPDNPRIQSRLAWVSYNAKDDQQAYKNYAAVVENFKDEYGSSDLRELLRQTRMILSSLCVRMGRIEEAESWLIEVLHEFPQNVGAFNDLGYLWADQNKRLDQARRMIEAAVASDPENAAYLDSLGWVYFRLGDFEGAIEQLKKAAAISQQDPVLMDHLGDAYQARGQTGKAREAWRNALQLLEGDQQELRDTIDDKLRNKAS